MNKEVYLAGGVRTAIGSFCGAFESVPAVALGSAVVKGALSRAGLSPDRVDEVIFGNVVGAGLGQNVARQVALGAGLSPGVPATTVNKVCGSGLKAVMLAAQAIKCDEASVVVAGGTENMSRAPYLLDRARGGYRMGNGELIDAMIRDGLWDVFNNVHMGLCGDRCAQKFGLTREQQDEFAVASFKRALDGGQARHLCREIEPIQVKAGKEPVTVTEDENPKKFNEGKLREVAAGLRREGNGHGRQRLQHQRRRGRVVVLSEEKIKALGITPQARILGYATYAREPEWFTLAPIGAIEQPAGSSR